MNHRALAELHEALDPVRAAPRDTGVLEMIVRRPDVDERAVCEEAVLDPLHGLVGDNWGTRESSRTPDRRPHPDMQITLMNSCVIALLAGSRDRWALAGDQLYVDFDLSEENLPAGTQFEIGSALLVVTDQPHTGCRKFAERFGPEALQLVSSPEGRRLRLRGIYAKVLRNGTVHRGDAVRKRPI